VYAGTLSRAGASETWAKVRSTPRELEARDQIRGKGEGSQVDITRVGPEVKERNSMGGTGGIRQKKT